MGKIEQIIKQVISYVRGVEGVKRAWLLDKAERDKVLNIELEAEKKVFMGLGKGFNEGLREVLSRQVVLAFLANSDAIIHLFPAVRRISPVILVLKDQVIGEVIEDDERLEELKKKENVLALGTFVLYQDRLPNADLREVIRSSLCVFPGFSCPEIEKVDPRVCEAISCAPSPPTHSYLLQHLGLEAEAQDPDLATFLVGFNISS